MPGVLRAEPYRSVSVRLHNGHLARKLSIIGKPQRDGPLPRARSRLSSRCTLPESGLVVGERVAEILHLRRGDVVEVEILEGRRGVRHVPVTDVIKSYFGLTVFMDIDALDRSSTGARLTGVHIAYDARHQGDLFTAIKSTPGIGSIALQRHALARFRETIAQNINYSVTIYVTLAVIIAFGVVYNSARIQLSEHARELASLRVLGFTRAEVSRVLLTELALLTLAAIPLGWAHRLRLRLAADPGLLQRPLSRALHHRAGDLRQGQPRRAAGDGGLRTHRAPAHRQARPHRRAEDPGLGAAPCGHLPAHHYQARAHRRWRCWHSLARSAWAMWPKPVGGRFRASDAGAAPRDRRRGGQDPHQGCLHRLGADHRQAACACRSRPATGSGRT